MADGFHNRNLEDGILKTISVEEMTVATVNGAEHLIEQKKNLL